MIGHIRRHKRLYITLAVILALLLVTVIAFAVYINDYYAADKVAIEAFSFGESIRVGETEEGYLVFHPEGEARHGLIFYPGGKVEHTAYEPLMRALAERGILCVLVEMPFRLAVLDINAAEDIPSQFPKVSSWYMCGHSLGGSMAASHLKDSENRYVGLVLLAAYSTEDLTDGHLAVLSIRGSEDGVLNMEDYEENKENLPSIYTEYVIPGGNHAFFGTYGAQEGDGSATLTNEEQITMTAKAIAAFIFG